MSKINIRVKKTVTLTTEVELVRTMFNMEVDEDSPWLWPRRKCEICGQKFVVGDRAYIIWLRARDGEPAYSGGAHELCLPDHSEKEV